MLSEMSACMGRLDPYCVVAHGDTETTAYLSFHVNSDGADVLLEGSHEASQPIKLSARFFPTCRRCGFSFPLSVCSRRDDRRLVLVPFHQPGPTRFSPHRTLIDTEVHWSLANACGRWTDAAYG